MVTAVSQTSDARFDFRRFLDDHFHSPAELQAILIKHGFNPPKLSTAEKWWSRGSVPGGIFALLLIVAAQDGGGGVEIKKYLLKEDPKKS